jgi:hypothetical protein
VQVRVGLAGGGDPAAITSLFRWLARDPEVRRHAEVSLDSGGSAGEMGALDVINIVPTQGVGLLGLALAYAAWRDSRAKAPPMTISIGAYGGSAE